MRGRPRKHASDRRAPEQFATRCDAQGWRRLAAAVGSVATKSLVSTLMLHVAPLVAVALAATAAPPSTPPPLTPVVVDPVIATVVESHVSAAAAQLVVVVELSTTETVETNAYRAMYVTPDGSQDEAVDAIQPNDVFAGVTALIVMVFPTTVPGGTVMLDIDTDSDDFTLLLPVPPAN